MMTTENVPTRPQPVIGGETAGAAGAGGNRKNHPSSDSPAKAESLKCPRCDSTQTKFCYYNNYSLTQPRHFCKTCRRYWTRGGTLRNVPIGGGCRKNKKVRPSSNSLFSSSTPSLLSTFQDPMAEFGDLKSEGIGGIINFFHGSTTTTNPPGVDFQLGGGLSFPSSYQPTPISITPLTPTLYPQISSFADISTHRCRYGLDLTAGIGGGSGTSTSFLGSPVASAAGLKPTGETSGAYGLSSSIMDMGSSNLLTSIDSLSPTNQELQWKLQQQRLAVLYGQGQEELEEENREDEGSLGNNDRHGMQKPQPILFQNLGISSKRNDHRRRHQGIGCGFGIRSAAAVKEENAAVTSTEWFFENPRISNGAAPRSNHGGSSSNNDSGITNFVQAWNYGNHHH